MFEQAGRQSPSVPVPRVLHHYTTWAGAEGILSSQHFWATAHHCTNDEAELASADTIIIEVAKELRSNASGTPAKVLDSFIGQYSKLRITESMTVCLACFSIARDDKEQWRRYSDDGRGICLSLRVLDEPGPQDPPSRLLKVDYSESSWRDNIRAEFKRICSAFPLVESSPKNLGLGVSALNWIAAFQCMTAKQPGWAAEQEFRHVTLVSRTAEAQLKRRESVGGTKWYLPVRVRSDGKRIALAEILIGPNRNAEKTCQELKRVLADNGYEDGSDEYPTIATSMIPPWHPAR